jgi:type IV pilus assembly protein PilN
VIRINLLPQKRRRLAEPASGGELWVLGAFGLLLAQVALFFVFHGFKEEELREQSQKNSQLQSQIDQSKKAVANHEAVKKELERMRAREDAIAQLQSARTGPTAVLLELARILTPGRGPSVNPEKLAQLRRDNPLAVYNPSWDARRLWITSFVETSRMVKLEGAARDAEDVSELARRLMLSDYFESVRLLPARTSKDDSSGLEVVVFALEAQVKY